ncbi:SipW-dependent-type signal peptide-containing protein [Longibaculum muris]|uniref:SipW-dependent-type signal peptide-containing protein n=1 Tax=Longibaculum muris TaxID=1796628 RepID=UPI0012B82621|nr:SipW-dependent-type signal peptide-containing protein [Longibaculum muris]
MKNKKTKTMIACLALVGVIGLGSTLAYLSDKSNTLSNTFVVGSGYIPDPDLNQAVWIDETKVGEKRDNEKLYEDRTLSGNDYVNVLAGGSLTKDPVLRVNKGSVKSYVYLKVEGLDELDSKGITTTINTTDWEKVMDDGHTPDLSKNLDGIYRFKETLDPTNNVAATSALFNTLTVSVDFDGENVDLNNVELAGCAVQAVTYVDGNETPINLVDADAPQFN